MLIVLGYPLEDPWVLIFFGLFFLLLTLDFFLETVLDLNIPGAVSVAVYACGFLLLSSGFNHTIRRASRG